MNIKRETLTATPGPRVFFGAVGDRFLTCTELKLLSDESTCNINRTDLDTCITQREIYRMSIIMLIMRQKDLSSVYM